MSQILKPARTCYCCHQHKEGSEFHGGPYYKLCKACAKIRDKGRVRNLLTKRVQNDRSRARGRKYSKNRDPFKAAARRAVRAAILAGKLIRPKLCQRCGTEGTVEYVNGRPKIEAHHYLGYDKPLEVQWLCRMCHIKEDVLAPAQPGRKGT